MQIDTELSAVIRENVALALREDIGDGDLTAKLVGPAAAGEASITAREPMIMAGQPWVDEVCRQVDRSIDVEWLAADGHAIDAETVICRLRGSARSILSAERTALNFLQLLSATATVTSRYVQAAAGSGCRILDTRKTIPGLRLAQKYAVRCGGGHNHRIGLFDAILIKENHIASAGSIAAAIEASRRLYPDLPVEIEVECIGELRQALAAKAERLLLDNFGVEQLAQAVAVNRAEGDPPATLEASGGLELDDVAAVAATGVDYLSVGSLTKHVRAIDLSMRFGELSDG
jgi:nicotinate-nucleotide pyrophosphorylase (carboxylating)